MTYAPRCPSIVYEVFLDKIDVKSEEKPLVALTSRLPHLKSLNVDAISLSPIFVSPEPMRMHTSDYLAIDPCLGEEDDLVFYCTVGERLDLLDIDRSWQNC